MSSRRYRCRSVRPYSVRSCRSAACIARLRADHRPDDHTRPNAAKSRCQARAQPSADLLNAVQALGASFTGEAGISVRDIDEGWVVAWEGDRPRPQQSVSKFWVAIAVMDAVDRGRMSLADPVTVTRSDLTLFHQPIRALVGKDGYRTTIGDCCAGR